MINCFVCCRGHTYDIADQLPAASRTSWFNVWFGLPVAYEICIVGCKRIFLLFVNVFWGCFFSRYTWYNIFYYHIFKLAWMGLPFCSAVCRKIRTTNGRMTCVLYRGWMNDISIKDTEHFVNENLGWRRTKCCRSRWRIPKLSIFNLGHTLQHFERKNVSDNNHHLAFQVYFVRGHSCFWGEELMKISVFKEKHIYNSLAN